MSKMAIIAKLVTQDGKRDELVAAFAQLFPAVEQEPGTEVYALHKDANDDNVVWFYELYTDAEAAAAHGTSDAMKAFGSTLGSLLAGRAELNFLTPERAKGLEF